MYVAHGTRQHVRAARRARRARRAVGVRTGRRARPHASVKRGARGAQALLATRVRACGRSACTAAAPASACCSGCPPAASSISCRHYRAPTRFTSVSARAACAWRQLVSLGPYLQRHENGHEHSQAKVRTCSVLAFANTVRPDDIDAVLSRWRRLNLRAAAAASPTATRARATARTSAPCRSESPVE